MECKENLWYVAKKGYKNKIIVDFLKIFKT